MTLHTNQVQSWNATRTEYPRGATVPDLFEEQVRRSPQSVAISPENGADITYAELSKRVERVAGALAGQGVGMGDIVAVALERSVEGYVAILGILRLGAVYLPVDLAFPPGRIEGILADADCRWAVTSQRYAHLLPSKVTAVDIGRLPQAVAPPVPGELSAESPAYVLYTSGSTGEPKGVIIAHRGIVRLVRNTDLIGFTADDVVCGTVNLTFDLSVLDLFGPLLNGARLFVPAKETLLSAAALDRVLAQHRVTVMWLGAALFHQMAAQRPEMFRNLRCLIAGGDALNPGAVRAILDKGRPGQLIDGYGPTENTSLSTAHIVEDLPPEAESVPIGRPISNSTAYVVRTDGTLADVGEEGELWVGGDGVALGYLNEPGLTAERFVPDRFSPDGHGLLYRTGDMGRWRADGVIEFLGRRDRQMKLGGFRVELREIEIVLAAHPQVKEAVVEVRETAGENKRLLGWVVAGDDAERRTLPMLLRQYLRDRLPVFMVPHEIKTVDAMPINASGKVDRATLLSDDSQTDIPLAENERPQDGTERAVAEVWQLVLGITAVRRTDDFFGLGGTSLQAAQVAAAISHRVALDARHGRYLIRTLLDNATVVSFTERIDSLLAGSTDPVAEPAVDFAREAQLPGTLRFDAPLVADVCDPHRVLLTGATGFQGGFLLDQLVKSGVREVWCLVRASDADAARRRLAGRMRRYGLDYDAVKDHVIPVPGDISRPRLGLSDEAFDDIARSVDAIVHSGSLINFAYPYSSMKRTNVDGVLTLLDLATTHRRKPFHHVSTIITLVGFGTADVRYVMEDQPLAHAERISLGYAESKWVAERLVSEAAARGLPVSIYRPYEISGTRDRGIWNTDTLMCAWFRTIAETGLAPDVELPLDFVPVDYTAEAIVHILHTQRPDGRVYNLTNPHDGRLSLLVDRLRHMGYRVKKIPYGEWVDMVTELTREDPHHPMTAFMPMFNEGAADTAITVKEMYFAEIFPQFSRTNLERATQGAGLDLPSVDATLIDLYLRYFVESGFLTPPPSSPDRAALIPAPQEDHAVQDPAEHIRHAIQQLQPDMAAHVRDNALYKEAMAGTLGIGHLRRLIAAELHAQPSEIAAFTHLAQRSRNDTARQLFSGVAEAITAARSSLHAAAAALDIPAEGPDRPCPPEGAETFAEFISWLGLQAPIGAAAAALRTDLMLWCAVCAELDTALSRGNTPVPEPVRAYVAAYRQAPPQIIQACTEVITIAVDDGEDLTTIAHTAHRIDPVLQSYWRSLSPTAQS
ncbi:amino acid adenylation domain-containing protein [Streptomyces sp. L2]|uniref:amino acid adenylation domain-containing protein n=1 Tax=Streptomyces sp. L2 TaxID=2162665 RepID=UPI001011AE69|nr:amino acid adenylation domain-containing protein [Streptomyces sp. L2]